MDEYCNIKNNIFSKANLILIIIDFLMFFQDILFDDIEKTITDRIENLIEILTQYIHLSTEEEACDTEYDESNSNSVSFNEEEDENIIIENNEIYNIDVNIKDYIEDEIKIS